MSRQERRPARVWRASALTRPARPLTSARPAGRRRCRSPRRPGPARGGSAGRSIRARSRARGASRPVGARRCRRGAASARRTRPTRPTGSPRRPRPRSRPGSAGRRPPIGRVERVDLRQQVGWHGRRGRHEVVVDRDLRHAADRLPFGFAVAVRPQPLGAPRYPHAGAEGPPRHVDRADRIDREAPPTTRSALLLEPGGDALAGLRLG